jgi:hypothetical protein
VCVNGGTVVSGGMDGIVQTDLTGLVCKWPARRIVCSRAS